MNAASAVLSPKSNNTFVIKEDTRFGAFFINSSILGLDSDGKELFFTEFTDPSNGSIVIDESGGTLFYTPASDFSGVETFGVALSDRSDAQSELVESIVTVLVTPVNDPPVAVADEIVVSIARDVVFDLAAGYAGIEISMADLFANDRDDNFGGLGVEGWTLEPVRAAPGADVAVARYGEAIAYRFDPADVGKAQYFDYRVLDEQGDISNIARVNLAFDQASSVGDTLVVAYNIGSSESYTSEDGIVFAADTVSAGNRFASVDGGLYGTEVWSAGDLSYAIALDDGDYKVTLHFAEIWSGAMQEGSRVFDVEIEGARVDDDLDIFSAVGANAALAKTYQVEVRDGVLNLDLLKGVQNPKLSGLEIHAIGSSAAPPSSARVAINEDQAARIDLGRLGLIDGAFNGQGLPAIAAAPTHGRVKVGADGVITYTPDPDYFGADRFTYSLTDRTGAEVSADVLLDVRPVNDAPIAVDDLISRDFRAGGVPTNDGVASISFGKWALFENDLDDATAPGDFRDWNWELIDGPKHGELRLAGEASIITYLFDPETQPGTDSFTYSVFDEESGQSNIATVTFAFEGLPVARGETNSLALADAATGKVLFPLFSSTFIDSSVSQQRALDVVARDVPEAAESASMSVNGAQMKLTDAPAARFGAPLDLGVGRSTRVDVTFFDDRGGRGEALGGAQAVISLSDGDASDGRFYEPDLFVFDPGKIGQKALWWFGELDSIAFVGDGAPSAEEIVEIAEIVAGDTILRFDNANILTIKDYVSLSIDDIAF